MNRTDVFSTETTNCTTAQATMRTPTLAEMRQAVLEFKRLQHEDLRRQARLVETACQVCGRKPIVRLGLGMTIVVCPHLMAALRKQCPTADSPVSVDPLRGIFIEEFDDGPARW